MINPQNRTKLVYAHHLCNFFRLISQNFTTCSNVSCLILVFFSINLWIVMYWFLEKVHTSKLHVKFYISKCLNVHVRTIGCKIVTLRRRRIVTIRIKSFAQDRFIISHTYYLVHSIFRSFYIEPRQLLHDLRKVDDVFNETIASIDKQDVNCCTF